MTTEVRGIPLPWSDSGPPNESNAYGELVLKTYRNVPVAWICRHGGSMWLCRSCKAEILKTMPNAREATPEERAWLKNPVDPWPPRKRWWQWFK